MKATVIERAAFTLATAASLCAAVAFAGDKSRWMCKGAAHKPSPSGLYCAKCHEPIFANPVRFACDNKVLTRAYEVAISDTLLNIKMYQDGALAEPARCIMAGEIYGTPWTRDTAINVWNALAILDREVSRNTLMSVVEKTDDDGYIIAGQYWDAIIWAIGAYQYILVSGDQGFVKVAQNAIENSLAKYENEEFDENDGLFRGLAVYGDGMTAYPDTYAKTAFRGIKEWAEVPENRDRYLKLGGFGRHAGVVWPHAQGFWARAAFEKGDREAFESELHALAGKADRDGQFYEIYHPQNGRNYGGLQENWNGKKLVIGGWMSCPHQTWSATAYLSLIYYHVLGADIREGEVVFKPYPPEGVNEIAVKDFKVGETTFDVVVVRGGDGPEEATCKTTEKKRVKLFLSVEE